MSLRTNKFITYPAIGESFILTPGFFVGISRQSHYL